MSKKYTAEYFIAKFERIPELCWQAGGHGTDSIKRCALGHCTPLGKKWSEETAEKKALGYLLEPITKALGITMTKNATYDEHVYSINDAGCDEALALGDTPRERILNALNIVAAGILNEI